MVKVLDTTLRDGSYTVGFQFTAEDTSVISRALDESNVDFIEIGHGLGLNASKELNSDQAATDTEYLRATSEAVKKAKWGAFFIPGIGSLEHIALAADHGMDFLRFGTNASEAQDARDFVDTAKKRGMFVSCNFMKTYTLPPDEIGRLAAMAADFGADVVSLVDSAGGMLPEEIERYVEGVRRHTDITLGFHGHNNLGLALANSLKAIDMGVEIIDTSIRGIGRSAGNTPTEMLLLVLERRGLNTDIDAFGILDIAEHVIDPLLKNAIQVDSVGIVSGYAQFHSSYLNTVLEFADRYGVDPRRLIVALCAEDKVNAPAGLVDKLARKLKAERRLPKKFQVSPGLVDPEKSLTKSLGDGAVAAAHRVSVAAGKFHKRSVFNIVQAYRGERTAGVSPVAYDGAEFVVASAEVSTADQATEITAAVDGVVDIVFLDADIKTEDSQSIIDRVHSSVIKSKLLTYNDLSVWSRSIVLLIKQWFSRRGGHGYVLVSGENTLAKYCRQHVEMAGQSTMSLGTNADTGSYDVLVSCDDRQERLLVDSISKAGLIVDALIGSLGAEVKKAATDRGISIIRPDMRMVLHNEIATAIGAESFAVAIQGTSVRDGIAVAAGGVLASRGTVIVDSITSPREVYGVADGSGFLLPLEMRTEQDNENLKRVQSTLC